MAAVTALRLGTAGMQDSGYGERVVATISRTSGVTAVGLMRRLPGMGHGRRSEVAPIGGAAGVCIDGGSTFKGLKRTGARTRGAGRAL